MRTRWANTNNQQKFKRIKTKRKLWVKTWFYLLDNKRIFLWMMRIVLCHSHNAGWLLIDGHVCEFVCVVVVSVCLCAAVYSNLNLSIAHTHALHQSATAPSAIFHFIWTIRANWMEMFYQAININTNGDSDSTGGNDNGRRQTGNR